MCLSKWVFPDPLRPTTILAFVTSSVETYLVERTSRMSTYVFSMSDLTLALGFPNGLGFSGSEVILF